MIDHLGFAVSDYERSKAFYAKALAPLGYSLVMEVTAGQTESGAAAAGFGVNGKPGFWIGGEGRLARPLHVAIALGTARQWMPFTRLRSLLVARTTARPACVPITIRTITARLCSTPTVTTSRPSATRRREDF
jgi:catechol 2,3-dioxygenase-like lactoylglutathione lyase family enzyme